LLDEEEENEKTTLWVRGSSAFPLVPKKKPLPLVPRERSSDSKAAVVLSKTLRPLAATLRWFPLSYVLSIVALVVAGVALYFARTTPNEPARAAAPAPSSVELAAPSQPAPPPPAPAATAPAVPAHALPAAVVPAPSASVARPAPTSTSKPPIDIMSLPVAPPAPARARPHAAGN
jgi:hypothetical protein